MNKKSRSFKKELIYSFLSITLVSIILLGIFQIIQLSSLIEENQKSQAQTTKFLGDYIINYVQEYQRAIEAGVPDIKEAFATRDIASIKNQLSIIKEKYPGFVSLYMGDANGESLVFYPELNSYGNPVKNQNFSDREYYKELLENKETVISPVFPGRGGSDKLLITIAAPILGEKGKLDGYVLGALDLTALEEHVKNRNFGKEGYAVILDHNNNVIIHPDMKTKTELVNLSDDPIVEYINAQPTTHGGEYFNNSSYGKVFITYEKLEEVDGWTIWIGKPATVLTNTYKNAIITIIAFIIIIAVIMVGVSLFFANRLEKSIRNLLDYIKDYTNGYRNRFNVIKISGPKEVEELSIHFSGMIEEVEKNRDELIKLNTELETRVQERTASLESRNTELRAVNKLITSVSSEKDLAHFIQHCLQEIKPLMDYSIHVFFQDLAITSGEIFAKQNLLDYLKQRMVGVQQHIEPIQIEKNHQGFLIVDLRREQSIKASDQEFLNTFAGSLAVMLQNKFLFEQIRNKHAVLEAVLESMSDGLMLVNNQKEIEYVNDFFFNVVSPGDLFLNNPDIPDGESARLELVNLDDVFNRFVELFDVDKKELQAFFTDEKGDIKLEYEQKSKKPVFYILHKFSVMLDDDIIGEGLMLRDITKEEEIDTLKNNLISLTSHEFKTPITNIKGSVETLLRSEVDWDPEFKQELLEGVHEDIERIQHLVNDWMDISKIESGSMYVERDFISADLVIEKSMEQIPLGLRENAVLSYHNNLKKNFLFYADKLRVQQVLVNLFTNALRYNDAEIKKIEIILDRCNNYMTISVSDNGIGISEDHIEKIFNRFYQVDASATRRSGGTGLGLAICAGIMEAHEGKIEVKSEPERGSRFILYFPFMKGEK
ncbi:PAS domain-containing protein [Neobacillus notoginsengisoli]|uniref:histidine kinase n=1 Tax=Neobacillus notoginsengisoli TaxID=1578198 RepID=A0A417YUV6_9BACI|nr:sensor histidine kinase [Neobacillus notoginsengisoli]RHW41002.1 PAS domain-containing protein [Neobacillus notoginsengisoli]